MPADASARGGGSDSYMTLLSTSQDLLWSAVADSCSRIPESPILTLHLPLVLVVHPHVSLELIRSREPLATPWIRARKRPLSRVRTYVLREVARLDKTLVTVRTNERFFAVVSALVRSSAQLSSRFLG
jgi:hypothetical protein